MFSTNFDQFVCDGDSITCEVDGFEITARIVHDSDSHIDDDDIHSVDNIAGCDDAQHATNMAARQSWHDGDWFYCGVVLSVSRADIVLDKNAASLWGIECNYPDGDNSYLTETANELLTEAVDAGRAAIDKLGASAS
jgi:hypothetical protein